MKRKLILAGAAFCAALFLFSGFFQVVGVENLVGRIAHFGAHGENLGCFFRLGGHIALIPIPVIMFQIISCKVYAAFESPPEPVLASGNMFDHVGTEGFLAGKIVSAFFLDGKKIPPEIGISYGVLTEGLPSRRLV